MTQVNRIIYNTIPEKWAFDPEVGPFIRDLLDIIQQLKQRTGGNDDFIENQQTKELFPWILSESQETSATAFQSTKAESDQRFDLFHHGLISTPEFFSVSANHTTAGDEIIVATSNITVFLNTEPDEGERVIVKRNTAAGTVTIDPQGSTIDSAANYLQVINYESNTFIYSGEWLII